MAAAPFPLAPCWTTALCYTHLVNLDARVQGCGVHAAWEQRGGAVKVMRRQHVPGQQHLCFPMGLQADHVKPSAVVIPMNAMNAIKRTSNAVPCLQHNHALAGLFERIRSCETGHASTDDNDIRLLRIHEPRTAEEHG